MTCEMRRSSSTCGHLTHCDVVPTQRFDGQSVSHGHLSHFSGGDDADSTDDGRRWFAPCMTAMIFII